MRNEKLYHYNEICKLIQVPWYKRWWYRIRLGPTWMMKRAATGRKEGESALSFGRRYHQALELYFKEQE